MKTGCKLLVTAALGAASAVSPTAFAQSCSGGSDHGMDATGNECDMTTQTTASIDPSLWTAIAARLTIRAEHAGTMNHGPLANAMGTMPVSLQSGPFGTVADGPSEPGSVENPAP